MKVFKLLLKWVGYLLCALVFLFVLLLIIPEKEKVKSIQPRASTQFWNMKEGFRIAYTHLKANRQNRKTPFLFLHGGPGGYVHSSIIQTLEELTELGHDVYLYDQRGSGLSDRLPSYSDITFQKHISDLHEIITQKIKVPEVILIAQSFGCIIATHYSGQHPSKVEKIIFSSPGTLRPYKKVNDQYVDIDSIYPTPDSLSFIAPYNFIADVDNMALKPKAVVASFGALLFDKKLISDVQMDRMLNTLASQFTKGMVCDTNNVLPEEGGGGLYAYIATNSDDYPEIRHMVSDVESPVLALQGQCEYHSFGVAYEYVDLFPNAQYVFIEKAGHEIWWEQKDQYLSTIKEFLTVE